MYFAMRQDNRINKYIKLRDIESSTHVYLPKEMTDTLNDITTLFVIGDKESIYPDFIEAPVFLVSDSIKKILALYDETVVFKTVVITNIEQKIQKVYWLILTEQLEALSPKTTFYKNGWEKDIVLDKKIIGEHRVFQVANLNSNRLFVNLDVAESILRREFVGITFEKICTDGGIQIE